MQPYSRSRADNASPSSIACSRCAFASAAAVLRASSSATAARRRVAFTSPAGKKRPAAIAESSSSEDPKRWPGFSDSSLGVPNRSSTPSRTSSLSRNVPIALRSAAEVRGARCATSRGTSDCATTLTPSASVSRSCSGEPRLPLATARTRDEPSGGTPSEASAWAAGNSSRGGAPWADVCALAPAPPNCLRNIDLVAASRAWSFVRHTMSPAWTRERSSAPRRKLITTVRPADLASSRGSISSPLRASRSANTGPPSSLSSRMPRRPPSNTTPSPRLRPADTRTTTSDLVGRTSVTSPTSTPRWPGARPRTRRWWRTPSRKPGVKPSCLASCPRAKTCRSGATRASRSSDESRPDGALAGSDSNGAVASGELSSSRRSVASHAASTAAR
mmetsp:Transcript_7514/g.23322  ORF Transcript_7514/g.23322 Transcript_7514/m.23322 type:complete len:389 (+) Transcript_7514:1238-2404(+)